MTTFYFSINFKLGNFQWKYPTNISLSKFLVPYVAI